MGFSHPNVKLKFFEIYFLNLYDSFFLWFDLNKCREIFAQLKLNFYKSIKNIFKVSFKPSNYKVYKRAEILTL